MEKLIEKCHPQSPIQHNQVLTSFACTLGLFLNHRAQLGYDSIQFQLHVQQLISTIFKTSLVPGCYPRFLLYRYDTGLVDMTN